MEEMRKTGLTAAQVAKLDRMAKPSCRLWNRR
jgi:hypothetical protein